MCSVLPVAVAAACATFSDSDEGPPGPTPADDGTTAVGPDGTPPGDAPSDVADPNADPCDGFVPRVKPADATHVDCGSALSNIDTTTNAQHCGECGHSCGGSICSLGTCMHEVVVGFTTGQYPRPVTIAPPHVYFGNDTLKYQLWRASITALDPSARELVASTAVDGGAPPTARLFTAGHVKGDAAWLRGYGGLLKATLGDAAPAEIAVLPNSYDRDNIAVGSNRVYAMLSNRIVAYDVATNASTDVAGLAPDTGLELAIADDESEIFWITKAAVFRKRGAAEDRLVDVSEPRSLRLDDTFVYWIESATRTVYRLRRNAPAGSQPAVVVKLATATADPYNALAAGNGYVYFQEIVAVGSAVNTAVRRVHRCGGEPITISPVFAYPNTLLVDATHVYYGAATELRRVAR
jgi:hypothetical protein